MFDMRNIYMYIYIYIHYIYILCLTYVNIVLYCHKVSFLLSFFLPLFPTIVMISICLSYFPVACTHVMMMIQYFSKSTVSVVTALVTPSNESLKLLMSYCLPFFSYRQWHVIHKEGNVTAVVYCSHGMARYNYSLRHSHQLS